MRPLLGVLYVILSGFETAVSISKTSANSSIACKSERLAKATLCNRFRPSTSRKDNAYARDISPTGIHAFDKVYIWSWIVSHNLNNLTL